jgi:DNA-directed RNA polymerase specialized sigma24 family protein
LPTRQADDLVQQTMLAALGAGAALAEPRAWLRPSRANLARHRPVSPIRVPRASGRRTGQPARDGRDRRAHDAAIAWSAPSSRSKSRTAQWCCCAST